MSKLKPYGSSRGGGGKIIPADERHMNRAPQHGIDVALAQAAFQAMGRALRGAYANGVASEKQKAWYFFTRNLCRDVVRSGKPMSIRMRAACIKTIGEEAYQRILKANTHDTTPEVLKHLPLKPPTRKIQCES